MRVLVLLSPAKTLNWASPPAHLSALWSEPALLREADPVVEVMRSKSKSELKKLMSISDSIAELNHGRFQEYLSADEARKQAKKDATGGDVFRPAALAYDGPAFRGMDAGSFSEDDWAFGSESVRVLSGLYGVLKPTDLIQPYRLEMGSRVGIAGSRDLYTYWADRVTQCLLQDVQEGSLANDDKQRSPELKGAAQGSRKNFLVVNVASQEYSKAVDFGALEKAGGKVVTCVFKDDGRVLSFLAKRARGRLARHVVLSRAKDVSDLENFTDEGYRLDTSQCDDSVLVFTRSKEQRASSQASGVSNARTPEEAATTLKGKKRPASDTAATRGGKDGAKQAEHTKSEKKQTTARGRRPDRGERA